MSAFSTTINWERKFRYMQDVKMMLLVGLHTDRIDGIR